MITVKTRT